MSHNTVVDTLSKVNYIINQDEKEEAEDDIIVKYKTKMLFVSKDKNLEYAPNIKEEYRIFLIKYVDLIYILLTKPKNERNKLYNTNVKDINDNNIIEIIEVLKRIKDFEKQVTKKKSKEVYISIINSLKRKKNILINFIEKIIIQIMNNDLEDNISLNLIIDLFNKKILKKIY